MRNSCNGNINRLCSLVRGDCIGGRKGLGGLTISGMLSLGAFNLCHC